MKTSRWLSAILAVALLVVGPGAGLAQSSYYFWWQVVDEYGKPYTLRDGVGSVQCSIYRSSTHAAAVLHATSTLGTATASNDPLFSDRNGRMHFYSSISAPVDVNCYAAQGGSAFVARLDQSTHKIIVPRANGTRVTRFSINNAAAATNQSTGVSFPSGALIRDVLIQNLNPRGIGTYHVSVGFAGNHAVAANVNALVSAQALTSPDEWLRPHVIMVGTGNLERVDASHRGLALQRFIAGHGAAAGSVGLYAEVPYMVHVASGLDVVYSINPGTAGAARLHVYIIWSQYHSAAQKFGMSN